MNRKRSYLSLVIAIAIVLGTAACQGTTSTSFNSAGGRGRATIKATIGSNVAKSVARGAVKHAAVNAGTVADIESITVDAYNGSSIIFTGTPLTNNNGEWSVAVSDLPVGIQLTFIGHAYDIGSREIFTGTTSQTLSGPDDEIVIKMEPAQTGTVLQFLQISQISRPASIAADSTVPVSLSVLGNAGETVTYQVTPAEDGGTFSPSSGSITLTGTSATVVLLYTAPSTTGTYLHSAQLTDANDNSVETTFDTEIALDILDPTVFVQFNPVVTALTFTRSGSEVTLTAHVSDTGPLNELTYNWSYESDYWWIPSYNMTFADETANPAVLQGYNETKTGTLSLTVTNGAEGSTTVSYRVSKGQFRASEISNLLLLPHTVMSTLAPGDDCRSGAISGNYIALRINDSELGYYDIANNTWVNTHILTTGEGGQGAYGVAIDGDIMAYIKADTGTIGWYSISAGAGYDTDMTPDTGAFGRGDRGPTRIISNGRIVYVADGTLNIFDTDSSQNITTSVEVPDGRSLSFSGDIVAFAGTSGTLQYYNVVTEQTTDTLQVIGHDQWGYYDIAYPTIDSGTIVFGSSSGYVAYYTISDGKTVQLPFLLDSFLGEGAPGIRNGIIAVSISEEFVGRDLDGNGAIEDNGGGVLLLYDIPTGRTVSTGVKACCWGDISNGVIVYDTDEGGVNRDVNNDGIFTCVQTYIVISDLTKQYFGR